MKKEDVRVLLNLDSSIDVIKVEENKEKEKKVKYVYIKSNKKKLDVQNVENLVINYMTI